MAKSRMRFTALDFVLIIIFLSVIAFYFFRASGIEKIKNEYIRSKVIVTLKVDGVKKDDFKYFIENEDIYKNQNGVRERLGFISDIRSCPSVKLTENESGFSYIVDFSAVDLTLDVTADAVLDKSLFYSIDGNYYIPALVFDADNGRIKFDCEVVSVKKAD